MLVALRLLAVVTIAAFVSFVVFGFRAFLERSERRDTGNSWGLHLNPFPRAMGRGAFSKAGWRYYRIAITSFWVFVLAGVAIAFLLPKTMN